MDQEKKILFTIFVLTTIILFVSAACQLPLSSASEKSPDSDLEATIAALQTQMVQPSQEEDNPTPDDPIAPTEIMQTPVVPDQYYTSQYKGFVALQNGRFTAFDFNGIPLGIEFPAGTSTWYGDNEIEVFPDEIFYAEFSSNSGAFRVSAQGTQKLDFIDDRDPVSIAVSPTDKKLPGQPAPGGMAT